MRILGIFTLVVLIASAYIRRKMRPVISGKMGENRVGRILRKEGLRVFNNVIFMIDGRTVQIDHIAISINGIFVIETKNHHGVIYGDAYKKEWYQNTPSGGRYRFYNPVWQNYGHVKTVEKLLGLDEKLIRSVVVFASDPLLAVMASDMPVITAGELPHWLKSNKEPVLSPLEVEYYAAKIKNLNCQCRKVEKDHVKAVQSRKLAA